MNKAQVEASADALHSAVRSMDSRTELADLLLATRRDVLVQLWLKLAGRAVPRGLDDVAMTLALVNAVWGPEEDDE